MMYTRTLLPVVAAVLGLAACDGPAPTNANAPAHLGRTTLEEFRSVAANKLWFEPAYEAYPGTAAGAKTRFDSSVSVIRGLFNPAENSFVMFLTPDCPCHSKQQIAPAVIKSLESAGVTGANMTMYVTNGRMEGIENIQNDFNPPISSAPTIIVMSGAVEKGRFSMVPPGSSVEQEIAGILQKR